MKVCIAKPNKIKVAQNHPDVTMDLDKIEDCNNKNGSSVMSLYLTHMGDSSANAANKEHLDNFKRDVINAMRRPS